MHNLLSSAKRKNEAPWYVARRTKQFHFARALAGPSPEKESTSDVQQPNGSISVAVFQDCLQCRIRQLTPASARFFISRGPLFLVCSIVIDCLPLFFHASSVIDPVFLNLAARFLVMQQAGKLSGTLAVCSGVTHKPGLLTPSGGTKACRR